MGKTVSKDLENSVYFWYKPEIEEVNGFLAEKSSYIITLKTTP